MNYNVHAPDQKCKATEMVTDKSHSNRYHAQELAFSAMESGDVQQITKLCQQALEIYPDCCDAIGLLADVQPMMLKDYVVAKRHAAAAGRRDLGELYIKQNKGHFWSDIDTRPYMRALASLADALLEWGQPKHVDEAITIYEQMLELNPNDNQGVRDMLHASYLQCKRYEEASSLDNRYKEDWMATPCWARVLLAYATGNEDEAATLLDTARQQNPHVELYLTGKKRLPRTLPGMYSPGDENEAVFCADALAVAWKKHPKARQWLKVQCAARNNYDKPLRISDHQPMGLPDGQRQVHDESMPAGPLLFPVQSHQPEVLDLATLKNKVPPTFQNRFDEIIERTDMFCERYLNDEYKQFSREMAAAICQKNSPVLKGKPDGWAAGLIHALGRINFLTDPSQDPHMKTNAIAKAIGVSPATMHAKAKIICKGLDLQVFDPAWTLPSRLDDNPLVWMIEVNDMILDIRKAPRDVQVIAYEQGLIPYIPADRDES